MKRNELIEKLIKEGFSENTLVKFSDKQINMLSERILSEQDDSSNSNTDETVMISKKNPQYNQEITNAKKQGKTIETYEGEIKSKNIEGKDKKEVKEEKPSAGLSKEKKSEVVKKAKKGGDIGKKGKGFEKIADKAAKKYGSKEKGEKVAAAAMWKNITREEDETKNWVKSLVENEKFHSFTSKNEIMELIQTKLTETTHGANVKKGHNGIPEFMTYDTLKSKEMGGPATAPTKPKPTTKPGTRPKPKTPYQPGPGPNPNPKALFEKK
jgi:hypothetical protein